MFFVLSLPFVGWSQGFTNIERYTDLSEEYAVRDIALDNDDHKYIATDNGLFKINGNTFQMETIESGVAIHVVAWDSKSGLWAAKNNYTVYQPGTDRYFSIQEDGLKITCLDVTATLLYIGTNKGLFTIAIQTGELEQRRTDEQRILGNVAINSIFVDPAKVRWIGTDSGVFRFEGKKMKHYEKESRVTAFGYTDEGVWIIGDEEMWLVDAYNRWAPAAVQRGLSAGNVSAITSDRRGQIYLASDILVQFNPYSDEANTLDESYGFVNNQSTTIICDRNDQVWVGTASRGLFKIDIATEKNRQLSAVIVLENEITCAGSATASLLVKVKGGKPPYSFDWKNSDISGDNPKGLSPGKYTLVVQDSSGHVFDTKTTIPDRDPLVMTILETESASSKTAKNGQAEVEVKGGKKPYVIKWDSGEEGANANQLGVGNHNVVVTDALGCTQEAEVEITEKKVMAGLDVKKLNVGSTLNIEQLFFDADSTQFRNESVRVLDEIFDFLSVHSDVIIEIGGHTNSVPSDDYCDRLSTARAKSVATYLYDKGISNERIAFKGYGKRNPIASNQSREGRQRNQRVEVKILSLGSRG